MLQIVLNEGKEDKEVMDLVDTPEIVLVQFCDMILRHRDIRNPDVRQRVQEFINALKIKATKESAEPAAFDRYSLKSYITGVEDLTAETYETAHGGYDPVYANADADRVLPVDVMRNFVSEGIIGKLHNKFYTTVGNGTSTKSSKQFAAEYAQRLKNENVQAVILTST